MSASPPLSIARPLTRRTILGGIAATLLVPVGGAMPVSAASSAPAHLARREKPAPSLEILTDILQQLPGSLAEAEEPAILFTFVDIEAQLTALGLPAYDPAGGPPSKDYVNATLMLPLAMDPFLYALDDEFVRLIGFHPLAAHQAMQIGTGTDRVILIRGGFDPKTIHEAWEATGYTSMTTSSGMAAWTSGPDGTFSPDDPLKRRTTGSMNNACVLDGEWLLFTRTFDQLDTIATFAAATTADSLFAAPGVRETIAMLNDATVAAIALPGSLLTPGATFPQGSAIPDVLLAADKQTGALPAATLLLTAVTGGLRPLSDGEDIAELKDVVVQARLALADASTDGTTATDAAATIAHRWESLPSLATGAPYADYLAVTEAEGMNNVAALDFSITGSPAFWSRMADQRDWLPFVTTDNT